MAVESIENQRMLSKPYDHARYEGRRRILLFLLRSIGFPLLAKIDHVEGVENVPQQGAAILMINHIAFIDSIVALNFAPRFVVPMAKIEVYDYPVIGIVPKLWGVIPVRREEVDRRAIQLTMEVLKAGEMVLVAPEGTRGTELRQGKVGIAYLASRADVPVVPVAIEGSPGFPALRFTRAWKNPGVVIRYGRPFRFKPAYQHAGHEQLRQMTDEAMYMLAEMLPPQRRGVYADLAAATRETIEFV